MFHVSDTKYRQSPLGRIYLRLIRLCGLHEDAISEVQCSGTQLPSACRITPSITLLED
jgi:hypothetical protein